MQEIDKTHNELLEEVNILRQRVAELEQQVAAHSSVQPDHPADRRANPSVQSDVRSERIAIQRLQQEVAEQQQSEVAQKQVEEELRYQTEALKSQQKWLEAILDLMPTPMVFIDPETAHVTFINRAAKALGVEPSLQSGAIDESITAWYCTNATEQPLSAEQLPMAMIARGERLEGYEIHWHTPTGIHSTLCWGEVLPAMYGHPAIGICTFQDITSLKQAETDTQAANLRTVSILESITDAFFALDRQWRFIYVNHHFEEICHLPQEMLLGQCIWEIFPASVSSPFYEQYHRAVAEKVPVVIEAPQPSRPERWVEAHAYPLADGLAVYFRDVTDRKQIEQERVLLLEREQSAHLEAEAERQRLNDILMQLPSMIAIVSGAEHRFELANPTYLQLMGRSADIIHQPLQTVFSEMVDSTLLDTIDRVYQTGESFVQMEVPIRWDRDRDGCLEEAFFNCVFAPLYQEGQSGEVRGVLLHGIEVTAQVQARHQVEALLRDLQQKEIALQDSQELLRLAVESADLGMWDYDLISGQLTWSDRCKALFGLPSQMEMSYRIFLNALHPDDRQRVDCLIQDCIQSGDAYNIEYRTCWADGSVHWIAAIGRVYYNDDHSPVRMAGIVFDITPRKQAQAERERLLAREQMARAHVEKVQQQLSAIFETSPVGIAFLDQEQRFVAINAALAEIHGLSRQQHIGRTVLEIFGHTDPGVVELFQQIYATGERFISSQFTLNAPGRDDRRPGYYSVYYLPTLNAHNQVESVLAYMVDITERVRLEQAQRYLAEASTVLASSLDYQITLERVAQLTVPDLADWCAIYMKEETGAIERLAVAHVDPAKIAWANQLQEKYPMYPDHTRGVALTLSTGQSELVSDISDEFLTQIAHDAEHLELLRGSGLKSIMAVPLQVQDQIVGVISFVSAESGRRYVRRDLVMAEELARRASQAIEHARLYQTAQRDRARAEAANRIKDEFLAVLSHELRTPLNPILGWTKLLRTRQFDQAAIDRALETIERNAKLQTQLIEDLLDISRILQGKLRLTIDPVNLKTVITAALETVRLSAEAKAIDLQVVLPQHIEPVLGDANRLQQVVWNLLSNAIKFTPRAGRAVIRLESVGTQAIITVSDTGQGISADFLPFIFEAFRQADGQTTRQFGGLGLGLSIARHLVELHGGSIQAESKGEGKGATFTVKLPLMITTTSPEPLLPQAHSSFSLTGIRALAVDDDADSLDLVTFILEQAGASVMAVPTAETAISTLEQWQPDIILSDIGMPNVDGYMLMRQLRSHASEHDKLIPAIALTAYAAEYDQQQALAAGFQLHLTKPIEPEGLVRAVMQLVKGDNPGDARETFERR